MKIISWIVFLVISMLGYNATTEAPTVVTFPSTTMPSDPPRLRSKATTTTTSTTTAPTTTTPIPGIESARYPGLWAFAVEAGWPTDRLPVLDLIAYHESRGQTDVVGTGAYGALQIQWSAHKDWLISELNITEPEQLFDPLTNMVAALWLAEYAEKHYGCWAQPWYMSIKTPYKYCK